MVQISETPEVATSYSPTPPKNPHKLNHFQCPTGLCLEGLKDAVF